MPAHPKARLVAALGALLLSACGTTTQSHAATAGASRHATAPTQHAQGNGAGPSTYVQANPPGPPVTDPAGRACLQALKARGVSTTHITDPSIGILPSEKIALSSSLTSGPFAAAPGDASGIETATWNLLSSATGLPLTPYLGRTLLEVGLINAGSTAIGGFTCFEQGETVVGMFAEQPTYSLQPMAAVTIDGRTIRQLTGRDYLHWLESVKAYVPHPLAQSPGLSAAAVLLDSFDVLNADLPPGERRGLEIALGQGGVHTNPLTQEAQVMQALVPIAIVPWQPPRGVPAGNPRIERMFNVSLWPHFRDFQPRYLAGNGWVDFFYGLARKTTQAPWRVTGFGTGP
jgi:hypothetical protein